MITPISGTSQEVPRSTIERLKGRNLGEVVRQFVITDPEVDALIDRAGMRDRFDGGQCPLRLSDYHWPLDAKASDFEFRLTCGVGILVLGGPEQGSTRAVSALSAAVANRLEALRELLLSGSIQAWGFTAQFVEQPIPARLWARKGLSIDVVNGDLCEEHDSGSRSTLWSSVELRSAMIEAVHVARSVEPTPSSRKRSSKGQEVERIIREHQIDVDELGPKDAAAAVAKYMKSPPKTADDTRNLEKQVARISRELRRTS